MKVKEKTMKIDDMKAGRELDALVAEKVMGWIGSVFKGPTLRIGNRYLHEGDPIWTTPEGDLYHRARSIDGSYVGDDCPHYSTDIAAAWQVVEKVREKYVINIEIDCENIWVELWQDSTDEPSNYKQVADEYGDTAPLAICLAALKAIE